jgi:four helix bundle protein
MQDFRNLLVWQANRALTVQIYRATATFPADERFGLTSQMRRACVSIGAGLAEGCGRNTIKDTLRFFQMSFASATELLHHLITALDLGFLTQEQFHVLDQKLLEIRKMLTSLMKRLRDGKN